MAAKIDWNNLGFEINPADKMFTARYKNGEWSKGEITDYGTITLFPSAVVLNYGQGLFEGLKAYRTKTDHIVLFRPYENAKRLNRGCRRLCMPEVDEEFFLQSTIKLLMENKAFVPPYNKGELYIRPIVFGSGQMLGVNPAHEYFFIIFMSPVGPYFKKGFSCIHIEIRDDFHRAPLYGTGDIKAIGNYATSLYPKSVIKKNGYDEVLYLDAKTSTYIDEVGSANFFLLKDGILSTPKLHGSILPGITRDSLLTLAASHFKLPVLERDIRYEEAFHADELFCAGTATIVTPIISITYRDTTCKFNDGKPGDKTTRFYRELRGIQLAEKPDTYGWLHQVE